LYVGLKKGVTRQEFEGKIQTGNVADCFHRMSVKAGDVMFVPSGRVHALGAGQVIFEIQQNSDTTYRVFDWNRVGLDGKPRDLHLAEAMECIDFEDNEPDLIRTGYQESPEGRCRPLVRHAIFHVDHYELASEVTQRLESGGRPHLLAVTQGCLSLQSGTVTLPV